MTAIESPRVPFPDLFQRGQCQSLCLGSCAGYSGLQLLSCCSSARGSVGGFAPASCSASCSNSLSGCFWSLFPTMLLLPLLLLLRRLRRMHLPFCRRNSVTEFSSFFFIFEHRRRCPSPEPHTTVLECVARKEEKKSSRTRVWHCKCAVTFSFFYAKFLCTPKTILYKLPCKKLSHCTVEEKTQKKKNIRFPEKIFTRNHCTALHTARTLLFAQGRTRKRDYVVVSAAIAAAAGACTNKACWRLLYAGDRYRLVATASPKKRMPTTRNTAW